MLSEQRHEIILKMLEEKRSVTVTELTEHLGISESTARRCRIQNSRGKRTWQV